MPLRLDDLIELLAEICDERNLKVTVKQSLKGGLITGSAAVLGGLLLGPIGLAIGGAVGGGAAAVSSKNSFKPLGSVLLGLSSQQKQRLYEKLLHAFRDFGPQDAIALSALMVSQASLTDLAVDVVKNFISKDVSLSLTN